MTPLVKYTLARLALFVVVAAAVLVVPVNVSPMLKLMVAILVSAGLAFFILRRLRDEASVQAVNVAQRRTEKRERLRAALNGDDDGAESATKAD